MVRVAEEGVPSAGVTNVGLFANTRLPEPVSSETANASLALVGSAKNVATLAPRPLTPELMGKPVALVNTAVEGVPRLGVVSTGLVENTTLPVPVSSVNADARLELDGVAKNVATPVPNPEIPVATGRPVALVNVAVEGVPRLGVVNTALAENTKLPVPVSSLINVAS